MYRYTRCTFVLQRIAFASLKSNEKLPLVVFPRVYVPFERNEESAAENFFRRATSNPFIARVLTSILSQYLVGTRYSVKWSKKSDYVAEPYQRFYAVHDRLCKYVPTYPYIEQKVQAQVNAKLQVSPSYLLEKRTFCDTLRRRSILD